MKDMSTTTRTNAGVTLEEITRQKMEIRRRIKEQKQNMQASATELFAPVKAANKIELIMNSVNSGMAVVDGVMTGMRLMRRVRGYFRRRR